MKLFRTQLRLLLGASPAEPLSLDAIMSRAGYAKNDGRPFYRQYAAALVALGLFDEHEPAPTGRFPRYSRTEEGTEQMLLALTRWPALRPLTPVDEQVGAPAPLAGGLSDGAARLLLALDESSAPGGLTLNQAVRAAGYRGDATTWYYAQLRSLENGYLVAPCGADEGGADAGATHYTVTPSGAALAAQIRAEMPTLPTPNSLKEPLTA